MSDSGIIVFIVIHSILFLGTICGFLWMFFDYQYQKRENRKVLEEKV